MPIDRVRQKSMRLHAGHLALHQGVPGGERIGLLAADRLRARRQHPQAPGGGGDPAAGAVNVPGERRRAEELTAGVVQQVLRVGYVLFQHRLPRRRRRCRASAK